MVIWVYEFIIVDYFHQKKYAYPMYKRVNFKDITSQ